MSESENISSLILERLNRIDGRLGVLETAIRRIDMRTGHIDSYMAGFHNHLRFHQEELDDLRGRVEYVEGDKDPPPDSLS